MHKEIIQQIQSLTERLTAQNIYQGGKDFYQVLDEMPIIGQKNVYFCNSLGKSEKYIIEFAPNDLDHIQLQKYLRRALFLLVLDKGKHVITARDFSINPNHSFVIFDWIPGKNLMSLMHRSRFQVREALWMLSDLVDALEHLGDFSFVHRNIHPKNIILQDKSGKIYLGGFEYITQSDFLETKLEDVNIHYVSPEVMRSLLFPEQRVFITSKSDIYSIGAVFFHLITGKPPLDAKRDLAKWSKRPPIPKIKDTNLSRQDRKYCQYLLKNMMVPNWYKRWNLHKIRQYTKEYLKGSKRDHDMERWMHY